jgi:putative transposase
MSTYRQIFYQIVFSTKDRAPTIAEAHEQALYKYIWGIINKHHCTLYRINSVPDHVHILSDLHPSVCLADYVKAIKGSSSLWMKECGKFPLFAGWQVGYGAFTYSIREKEMIVNYIKGQKEHHQNENFEEEYKRLLQEAGIHFDERYLL